MLQTPRPLCADEVNAVVVDVGSHTVKAGFAGEDTPKALFPAVSNLHGRIWHHGPASHHLLVYRLLGLCHKTKPMVHTPWKQIQLVQTSVDVSATAYMLDRLT